MFGDRSDRSAGRNRPRGRSLDDRRIRCVRRQLSIRPLPGQEASPSHDDDRNRHHHPPTPAPRPATSCSPCSRSPWAASPSAPPSSSRWACCRRSRTAWASRSRRRPPHLGVRGRRRRRRPGAGVPQGRPRRGLLVALMAAYGVFNSSVRWPRATTLIAARFLDGLPHGAYFGVASLVAASMAPRAQGPRGRRGHAGALVANVVGVPAATWLGQVAGARRTPPSRCCPW